MREITIGLHARPYQRELIEYFRDGGKHAFAFWHRKAGKDRVATFIESELAFKRVGLYWHALPKYEEARKVIWDAITPEGSRLIDTCFPDSICKKKNSHEMKIELINGSIWQPVGADNFNSLVGASPVHVTYSEFALMHPSARQFIRPAIAQNNGSELFISTTRGYNHASDLYEYAKTQASWYAKLLTVDDTAILSPEVLEEERRTMPGALLRQEYYCDRAAANVGAILGTYIEEAEREGRISDEYEIDPEGAPIDISVDIGRHDAAAFWFWQPRLDGFALVDYEEETGTIAEEWVERLRAKGYNIGHLWLPHDARNKTFTARHSPLEQFDSAGYLCRIVPKESTDKRINAARTVAPHCRFHKTRCKLGLEALRSWSYEFDEERSAPGRPMFSKEPIHDWASHCGDAFSYGCQMLQERVLPVKKLVPRERYVEAVKAAQRPITFDEVLKRDERRHEGRRRV